MASMSISGVVSGMDWESMIDELITAAAKPAQVQVTKRKDLVNKKSLFEEMKVMVQSIQTSMTSLKLPSTYKAKDIEIERVDGSGSYKKVLSATVNADAEVNVYDLLVKQIATAQTNRSNQITTSTISSALSAAGITSPSTMYINAGGQRVGVDVFTTDSLDSLKSRINNTIKTLDNPMNLTASVVDNRLVLKSDNTGLGITSTEETVRYNPSGATRLANISYDAAADPKHEDITVRNGSTTYTYGTDYVIVNGNELRWNTYEDNDDVKIGGEVTVNYTFDADDVYQVTGKMADDDGEGEEVAAVTGFDLTDKGTIGKRTYIVDEDGNRYEYGKDFEIKGKKVVWLDPVEVSPTNEPDSYTVTYSKTTDKAATVSKTKEGQPAEPASYTVSYSKNVTGSSTITGSKVSPKEAPATFKVTYEFAASSDAFPRTVTSSQVAAGASAYTQIAGISSPTTLGLNTITAGGYTYIDKAAGQAAFSLTLDDGTKWTYGKDYAVRDRDGHFEVVYPNNSSWPASFTPKGAEAKPSSGFTLNYNNSVTKTSSSSSDTVSDVLGFTPQDYSKVTLSDASGNEYTSGIDYALDTTTGEIDWLTISSTYDDPITSANFSAFETAYRNAYGLADDEALPTATLIDANGVLRTYIDPADPDKLTMTSGGKSYQYGRDYVIRVNDKGDGYVFSWSVTGDANRDDSTDIKDANTTVTTYTAYKGISTSGWVQAPDAESSYTFAFAQTADTTTSGQVNASDTDKSLATILNGETVANYADLVITDSDGNTYTYGTDFTVNSGSIEWLASASTVDDAISSADFTKIATAYREAQGLSSDDQLPTVTLVDGNGVLRTYLDPADRSQFTMTAGGKTYEYGRDYVIRVNDNGDGYVYSWALTGDTNKDGTTDIKDANTAVTTYTAAKGISTSGLQTAPDYSTTYTMELNYSTTVTDSVIIKKSDTDKNIISRMDNVSSADDLTDATITIKTGSTTLTAGDDYSVDSSGNIAWKNTSTPESFDVTYTFSETLSSIPFQIAGSATMTSTGETTHTMTGFVNNSGLNEISLYNLTNHVAMEDGKKAFTMVDEDENHYEYGKDYVVRRAYAGSTKPEGKDDSITIVWANATRLQTNSYYKNASNPEEWRNWWEGGTTPAVGKKFSLTYNPSFTTTVGGAESMELSDILGISNYDLSKVTISRTGSTTSDYTAGTDYTIDSDGKIVWTINEDAPKRPAAGKTYTLTYEAFDALTAEDTCNDESTQTVSIAVDEGSGNFEGTSLSYEQILEDTKLTSSSGDSKFKDYFSLTDENGNTYDYGTDYRVIQGSDTDSVNGKHSVMIEWISDGNTPASGAKFTLTYTGRGEGGGEILTTSVTRSATDTINPDTSSIVRPLYSTFAAASEIRITDGKESFFMGTDFTVADDGSGNAKIVWNSDLWDNQDTTNARNYTLYLTANGARTTFTGTRAAGSDELTINGSGASYPTEAELKAGTTTITQGTKTFYEGTDYTITSDDDGNAAIEWITAEDGGSDWYYPAAGSTYTINFTDANGASHTYTAYRNSRETLSMMDLGMTTANGSVSVKYGGNDSFGYNLNTPADVDENGNEIAGTDGHAAIREAYGIDLTKGTKWTEDGTSTTFNFNWVNSTQTTKDYLPNWNDDVTVEYEYTMNTFTLDDDGSGVVDALGLNDNKTDAHNLVIELDGEEIERDSNNVGETWNNEILKGVTFNFKGVGEVSLDIFQDAEKAVEAINTFTDNYNSLMQWMNTRMTESQVDKDTAATIDSDDFRMRWGLLHGNSLLRQTKSQMRNIMAQSFTYTFNQRASASEIYGTMARNGLTSDATLRMRVGSTYFDLSISPANTLQDIVDMINDRNNTAVRNNFYDEDGKEREQQLVKASIEGDRLVLTSTGNEGITLSGTSAMNALKLNYTYKGLFQIGLATTSTDYGKSGELEFDESKFMEALEDNPNEVQELMLMFAGNMDTWLKSMLTTSASGETSGTLTRQIEDLDTRIASIDEYLEKYQDRLDRQEESLRTKFAAAEQSIAKLSQQASSIAAILNQLNGYSSSSSSDS